MCLLGVHLLDHDKNCLCAAIQASLKPSCKNEGPNTFQRQRYAERGTRQDLGLHTTSLSWSAYHGAQLPTLWNMSQMAVRGWWMEATTVWPIAARQDMCSMMFRAAKESRPDVGSSRKSSDGWAISAHAMVSLRFSPPAPLSRYVGMPSQEQSTVRVAVVRDIILLIDNYTEIGSQSSGITSLKPTTEPSDHDPSSQDTSHLCTTSLQVHQVGALNAQDPFNLTSSRWQGS